MFDKERYGRILVPMITPFKQDQSVDYDAAVSVAEKLISENKADTLILTGTTGEFFTMNFQERVKVFEVVKAAVGDKVTLIAGTGAVSTIETIALSRKAQELGYDLVMVVSPYYTRPSQKELYNHFRNVAEQIRIDLIMYNIPIFTGVNINPETVAELAKTDNIVGIKEEAEINPKQITAYLNATPEDFIIYCGDDAMILEAFAQGGDKRIGGVVSGGSHLIGDRLRKMIETFLAGKIEEAARMQQAFLPLFRALSPGDRSNPACLLKDAMKMVGYNAGIPRLPLTGGTEQEIAEVKKIMKALNIIK
ncbi:MAG TPA: 4-hydroxy-tetrahydrodipicolinate synthase [Sedimentisphaerales bacterium]|nr:4-hydroxy-tetrahydrodipicolinate synthase [Sedimentisphaerales bacterium]